LEPIGDVSTPMKEKDRRQMWRVLEFAAKIAQEDEYTAMSLFNVAAGSLSYGHPLQREVAGLSQALMKVLTDESAPPIPPMFPPEDRETPNTGERK
jgi:hypothetical protein